MIKVYADGECVPHNSFKFSGGEIQVRLQEPIPQESHVEILAHLHSSDDLMELLLVTDAIDQMTGGEATIDLVCPYLPYARQDRVCAPGEAAALTVACRLIDMQDYATIKMWDVHNPVAVAESLHNWTNVPASHFVTPELFGNRPLLPIVIAPDKGAFDRATGVAQKLRTGLVSASKVRDPSNGKITHTEIDAGAIDPDRDMLIVDDICDGGRTFIELAKLLRPLTTGKIFLYVTHGIFSQGFEPLHEHIDQIFTPNPFRVPGGLLDDTKCDDFVTVLERQTA